MRDKVIERDGFKLHIMRANVLIGMRRTRMRVEGSQVDDDDIDRQLLRAVVYPDLIAPVASTQGFADWPISFEDFLELPETLVIDWENAVYELNPHWQSAQANEQGEKKQPTTSRRASSNGTKTRKGETQASYQTASP